MVLKNKRGQELAMNKLVFIILGIAVLIIAIVMMFNPKIADWIRGLPGYEPPKDQTKTLTPDEMRLLDFEKIGKVELGENSHTSYRQYYIFILERKQYTQAECETESNKASGYVWKTACYDAYGFLSDKADDKKCLDRKGTFGSACFDESGFLAYHEKYIQTPMYLDSNIGESYDGTIKISEFANDGAIGTLKNYFLLIDENLYLKHQSQLNDAKIDSLMMKKLNGAKYQGGGLYRSLSAPLTFNWAALVKATPINLDSKKLEVKEFYSTLSSSNGKGLTIDLSPYLTLHSLPNALLYLTQAFGYYSIVLNGDYSGSHEIGRIYSDNTIYIKKDYSPVKDYITISKDVKMNPNGNSIAFASSSENIFETNLKLDYVKLEESFDNLNK